MATAEIEDEKRIRVTVSFRERDLIKAVPGAKWSRDGDVWYTPLSWPVCVALRGIFGEELEVGEKLTDWGWKESDFIREAMLCAGGLGRKATEFKGLYPYQRLGVEFLNHVRSAVLADSPGLGKTLQTLATLEDCESYPALIVCPKSVKVSWRDTFALWAPHRKVVVVEANKKARQFRDAENADVVIVNWDLLRTSSRVVGYSSIRLTDKDREPGPLNKVWGAVVADEAHKAKDPKSKQTRALWAVRASADRALALTGTPVANDPRDFWSLLHFVEPNEWPGRSQFMDRYCLLSNNYWGGVDVLGLKPETRDEFYNVTGHRFIRRTKSRVLKDLPSKTYTVRFAPMLPAQKKAYDDMVKNQVAWLDEAPVAAFNPLTVTTRLLQFASASATVQEDGTVTLSKPSSKINELLEFLEESGDQQVVVFAVSRQLIDLAEQALLDAMIPCTRITGKENERQREANKASFVNGAARVMLMTMGAGGTGLDGLQEASSLMVFLQRSYNYVENVQAEDRLHRIGQHSALTIVDIITPGTLEETAVLPALQRKESMANEITRDNLRGILEAR